MTVATSQENQQHSETFRSNEMEVDATQIQNVPGKKNKLKYNDFFYTWKQDYKSAKEYICCEKRKSGSCPAKLKLYSSKQWIHIGQHNHAPPGITSQTALLDPERYEELVNWINSHPLENHYDSIIHQLNSTLPPEKSHNPKYIITAQHVKRAKRSTYSKRLENPCELVSRSDLAFTQDGQPFIRDGKFCPSLSIMFASPMQLNTLNSITEYDQIFFDATFNVCPYGVSQLITILVKKRGSIPFPVFYVFADSKEEKVYRRVLKKVSKMCPNLKTVTKLYITVDFEIAMHNAIRKVLPNAEIVGCSFHWRQSINRWINKNRSKDDLIKQPEVYEKLQADLKQLCETDQSEIFSSSIKNFEQYFSIIDVEFVQYLKRNYFNNDAPFPPTMWAHSQRTRLLPDKTNNPIEQYNKRINAWFKNRPSLKKSVLILQRSEYLARMGKLYDEQSYIVPEEFDEEDIELNMKRKATSELVIERIPKKIKETIEEANSLDHNQVSKSINKEIRTITPLLKDDKYKEQSELLTHKLDTLKLTCKSLKIPSSGSKQALAQRIREKWFPELFSDDQQANSDSFDDNTTQITQTTASIINKEQDNQSMNSLTSSASQFFGFPYYPNTNSNHFLAPPLPFNPFPSYNAPSNFNLPPFPNKSKDKTLNTL